MKNGDGWFFEQVREVNEQIRALTSPIKPLFSDQLVLLNGSILKMSAYYPLKSYVGAYHASLTSRSGYTISI